MARPRAQQKQRDESSEPGTPSREGTPAEEEEEEHQQQQQASKKGADAGNAGGRGEQTDIRDLDDAVGIAGVDINAEEEAIRASNFGGPRQQRDTNAKARTRPQIIIDEDALKNHVLRIAASFHLKNLESDSLPLIGLAVQMRLRTLIQAMIQAKEHRVISNHLRPPPMFPSRWEGDLPAPMWDQALYDDVEKILSTFDRVEREEERQARKDRMARDQAEQEERERLERLAAEQGEDGEAGPSSVTFGDTTMADAGTPGSMPGTPMSATPGGDKGKGKLDTGKKRKRDTPMVSARNMSDDVRKKLSDQTAMRNLGAGKKRYSWMSGGMESPLGGRKPKPKLPPLPPSSLSISTSAETKEDDKSPGISGSLSKLTGVPAVHEASKAPGEDPANRLITIRDALFVMENERGRGAGVGSGTKPMFRAYMGRT